MAAQGSYRPEKNISSSCNTPLGSWGVLSIFFFCLKYPNVGCKDLPLYNSN